MAEIQAPKKRSSPICVYFTLAEDERFMMCTKCEQKMEIPHRISTFKYWSDKASVGFGLCLLGAIT